MAEGSGFNPYRMARERFDHVAELLALPPGVRELLRTPMRELRFQIPVRLDDGRVQVYPGFRVQHNDVAGPCMGGIRFHPMQTIDTARALAQWMTFKAAALGIPVGGSMGGVVCDPHMLSSAEQEALCRGWVRQMGPNLGPNRDIPIPDVMTDAQHMLWMLDEYEAMQGGGRSPAAVAGKPVVMGGSLGQRQATGYGIVYLLREALKELGLQPSETTCSVQGFGKVAQFAVELFARIGGTTRCVTSWNQVAGNALCFVKTDGVDGGQLREITDALGSIDPDRARDLGYDVLPAESWLEQEVDVLLPAAIENQISIADLDRISGRVKVVAEGANGAITHDADAALGERGVYLIPDILANAGGMMCSYFEQVQSRMNYSWDLAEVMGKLDTKLTAAFVAVSDLARSRRLSLRDAAEALAVERVAQLCRERGLA